MFGSIFLKTLRDNRWGILGWGLGLGLIMIVVIIEYQQFVGNMQLAEFERAYKAFGFLIGDYVPINTLGGFLTMETMVYGAVLLGAWAAVAGVGMTRGEEEPGTLDVLLSTPCSRIQVFWQKIAALGVAIVGTIVLIGAVFFLGLLISGQVLPFGAVVSSMLNVLVSACFWGAVGVLVAQLVVRRRGASVLTGMIILATYLLNSLAETVPSLKGITWVLPFHYYNMSKPLVPGRTLDWWGIAALLAGTAVILLLSAWLFARRDAGASVSLAPARRVVHFARPRRRESVALLSSVFSRAIRDLAIPTLAWGLGLALYCGMMVGTVTEALAPMYQGMSALPWFSRLFGNLASNEAYLSVGVFFYLPVLLILFMLTQVWGWASDEEEGRMELMVSEPVPRWQIMVARYVTITLSLVVALALTLAGLLATAAIADVQLDGWRVAGAVMATAPLALVSLAFGFALATWLPRPGPATGLTAALVVLMFFISTLAPLFDWPDAVQHLSIFHYYGRPVLDGVPWGDMGLLMGAAVLLGGASLVGFQRRDIAK